MWNEGIYIYGSNDLLCLIILCLNALLSIKINLIIINNIILLQDFSFTLTIVLNKYVFMSIVKIRWKSTERTSLNKSQNENIKVILLAEYFVFF